MLVDHLIKLDVSPELKLPPPRSVRRRSGRGLVFAVIHILLLPFVLVGLILFLAFINTTLKTIADSSAGLTPVWGLALLSLCWNTVTAIFIWRIYFQPFFHRWLVIHGQVAIGHITEFSAASAGRGGELYVHYEFSPTGKVPMRCKTLVGSPKAWQELREGNTVIDVVYSPTHPTWNVPYVCSDYEVVNDAK